jgi:uncharacterized membrane protein YdbT with pleckstrin-like domain
MTRYINRILQPGERRLYSSKIHWSIYVPGLFVLLVGLVFLLIAGAQGAFSGSGGLLPMFGFALCFVGGLILLFWAWFARWTTEIEITDRRIVYKRGFIRRRTIEMNMDKVESVDVDQSILGRILNYGDITIRGVGVGMEPLRRIDAPLDFRNHVTAR